MTCFAVFVADEAGPITDDGVSSTCVAVFGAAEDAIAEAADHLREGYSVSVDIGFMTRAEWDALEEVPDDFAFKSPASTSSSSDREPS